MGGLLDMLISYRLKFNKIIRGIHEVALLSTVSSSNWNLKCWFLWREENRSTWRKTLGEGTRTNNKLNPHMTLRSGIEPGPHWWEASALTTAPSLLPSSLIASLSIKYIKDWRERVFHVISKQRDVGWINEARPTMFNTNFEVFRNWMKHSFEHLIWLLEPLTNLVEIQRESSSHYMIIFKDFLTSFTVEIFSVFNSWIVNKSVNQRRLLWFSLTKYRANSSFSNKKST